MTMMLERVGNPKGLAKIVAVPGWQAETPGRFKKKKTY
jgi:hypothetical protein